MASPVLCTATLSPTVWVVSRLSLHSGGDCSLAPCSGVQIRLCVQEEQLKAGPGDSFALGYGRDSGGMNWGRGEQARLRTTREFSEGWGWLPESLGWLGRVVSGWTDKGQSPDG